MMQAGTSIQSKKPFRSVVRVRSSTSVGISHPSPSRVDVT
jgi:hypothetical protein